MLQSMGSQRVGHDRETEQQNGNTDIENIFMDMWMGEEGQSGMYGESNMEMDTLLCVKQIASGNLLCDLRNSNQGLLTT